MNACAYAHMHTCTHEWQVLRRMDLHELSAGADAGTGADAGATASPATAPLAPAAAAASTSSSSGGVNVRGHDTSLLHAHARAQLQTLVPPHLIPYLPLAYLRIPLGHHGSQKGRKG